MANRSTVKAYAQHPSHSPINYGVFEYATAKYPPSEFKYVRIAAAEALEKEASVLFSLGNDDPLRYEPIRMSVLKVLLYIGFLPARQKTSIVAKLIESIAVDPEFDIDAFFIEYAIKLDKDVDHVKRLIDRAFSVYNTEMMEKVKTLTGTSPFTSRDVIYDLALYVRKIRFGRYLYE